ncbi:MAG: TonB-dependent receptor [Bacteroidales bacterium]|nr:TonB-dependent receptor [Bacteroidales bacterium]
MILFIFFLAGEYVYAQQPHISIGAKDEKLGDVLEKIEKQSGYKLFYSTDMFDPTRKVSFPKNEYDVLSLINDLLRSQGVSCVQLDGNIVMREIPSPQTVAGRTASDRTMQWKGRLIDRDNMPVAGAVLMVPGNNALHTYSDSDGNFAMSLPEGSAVSISCIGYVGLNVVATATSSGKTIIMDFDTQMLEETVVVGYGTIKKVNLSGSVSAVNVDELTQSRPVTNISQALAGAAAGVQVTSANNKPGSDDATILVRGKGTLNNSSPLVIIDGVEGSMSSVTPLDIESISILKDAASSAIYGSRAANGVILITTKSGKSGQMHVDYHGYASIQSFKVPHAMEPVSNYADYMAYVNEALENSGSPAKYSQLSIDEWRSNPTSDAYPNLNWLQESFNTGIQQNHTVSVRGGQENIRYYSSLNFLDNPGIMENSGQQKYSVRANIDADITKWLTFGINVSGSHADLQPGTDMIGTVFGTGYATTPALCMRSSDGRYGGSQNPEDPTSVTANNPLKMLNSLEGNRVTNYANVRFLASIRPFKNLVVKGSFNYNINDIQSKQKPVFLEQWNFQTNTLITDNKGQSYLNYSSSQTIRKFMDLTADYSGTLASDRLNFHILAGASGESWRNENFSLRKLDLSDMSLMDVDAATGSTTSGGNSSAWAMRSFFGRVNMDWEEKYLLELNIRADGSSRFAPGYRWGWFPSASVAWRISKEPFMSETSSWLDELKLRASYGGLGNNSVGNYSWQSTYASKDVYNKNAGIPTWFTGHNNYTWGNQLVTGMAVTALANSAITWETTYVTNVGVDFNMFRGRLSGTLEGFYKDTKNILISLPAPLVHGASTVPTSNAAEVSNKGLEVTLGWKNSKGAFNYSIDGNFSYVKNNVEKYKGSEYSVSNDGIIMEGLPIGAWYMYKYDRVLQTDVDMQIVSDMLAYRPDAFDGIGMVPKRGDILYKDVNGDGRLDSDDRTVVSLYNSPRYLFGLTLGLGWKGLDMQVLVQGMAGYKTFYSGYMINQPVLAAGIQVNKTVAEGAWREGVVNAKYPRLTDNNYGLNTIHSDFYLYDNSFVKIRNIQFGYTLPEKWTTKAAMEKVRFYVTLENFFTFTSFMGFDPEVSGLNYPTTKQTVLGVNITL